MPKYLLLSPMVPSMFGLHEYKDMEDALEEFACGFVYSRDILGNQVMFATAETLEILTNMTTTVELPGAAIEYTAIYDQFVEV